MLTNVLVEYASTSKEKRVCLLTELCAPLLLMILFYPEAGSSIFL
jgi:hypothetical protein